MQQTIHIPLDGRAYDVYVGDNMWEILPQFLQNKVPLQKSVVIITEDNVAQHYLMPLKKQLSQYNIDSVEMVLPAGEGTKSFSSLEAITKFSIEHHIERSDYIIALGGGVIGDLTGFAASMIRRGCGFIQIPTSLLAQVDSSVGGKTAINAAYGKNLIGAFYQPSLVLADINVLKTLPNRDYRAGFAEVIKYGLLGDVDFFDYLSNNISLYQQRDNEFLMKIISHSVQMKADIVLEDEREQGKRALLNLGHSFGHAYEAMTGYSEKLLHGEAVAIGMIHAFDFAVSEGLCERKDYIHVKKFIEDIGFETDLNNIISNTSPDAIIKVMLQDKKVESGEITLILPTKIGTTFIAKKVPIEKLRAYFIALLG